MDAASLRYKDKVVIVTGGSQGIGEGCVRVFGMEYSLYCSKKYQYYFALKHTVNI